MLSASTLEATSDLAGAIRPFQAQLSSGFGGRREKDHPARARYEEHQLRAERHSARLRRCMKPAAIVIVDFRKSGCP